MYGCGYRDVDLNAFKQMRTAEYLLYCVVLYGISMPLVKASVMCTVLAFARSRVHRWALYFFLFTASVFALVAVLGTLLYCHPVRAYWNPLFGSCGNFNVVVNCGYAWTVGAIVSDLAFIIVPYFIIRNLQMSRKSKITVMSILGLGVCASIAAIIRAPYLKYYLVTENRLC